MTEHKQLPSNLLVIDSNWLEKEIFPYMESNQRNKILYNSYQLTPILEDAWINGSMRAQYLNPPVTGESWDSVIPKDKQSYISQPITLKK
jgi:hypothetical protein